MNSIGYPVAISKKCQWKSIENPVKIYFEIKLEIEIGNLIGNSNGHLKFNRNNNEIPIEFQFSFHMNTICIFLKNTEFLYMHRN